MVTEKLKKRLPTRMMERAMSSKRFLIMLMEVHRVEGSPLMMSTVIETVH